MLMLSQTGWPPLQTVACVELVPSRFTISCNQPFLARPELVLFIKIDADFLSGRLTGPLKLIPIWQPFKSKNCRQTPSERFRGQKQCPRVRGAGSIAQSAVDLLYSIVNHRPGGLRSPVHRTGWRGWAGLAGLGWAGLAGLTKCRVQRAGRFRALRPRPSGLWGRSQ